MEELALICCCEDTFVCLVFLCLGGRFRCSLAASWVAIARVGHIHTICDVLEACILNSSTSPGNIVSSWDLNYSFTPLSVIHRDF